MSGCDGYIKLARVTPNSELASMTNVIESNGDITHAWISMVELPKFGIMKPYDEENFKFLRQLECSGEKFWHWAIGNSIFVCLSISLMERIKERVWKKPFLPPWSGSVIPQMIPVGFWLPTRYIEDDSTDLFYTTLGRNDLVHFDVSETIELNVWT